jgi:hypothetical protein
MGQIGRVHDVIFSHFAHGDILSIPRTNPCGQPYSIFFALTLCGRGCQYALMSMAFAQVFCRWDLANGWGGLLQADFGILKPLVQQIFSKTVLAIPFLPLTAKGLLHYSHFEVRIRAFERGGT